MDFSNLDQYAADAIPRFTKQLSRLVSIPSISSEPERKDDVRECAQFLAGVLEKAGVQTRTIETAGHPAVFGRIGGNSSKPTILIYNHYDVQPASREDGWDSEPFEPRVVDGAVYGRGATDDKGPLLTAVEAVRFLKEKDSLNVNVGFLYEGEEEDGSTNFGKALNSVKEEIGPVDGILVCDTEQIGGRPAITTSLRGLVYADLKMKSGTGDMHSGSAGGVVVNPLKALSRIVTECEDEEGRILVPGIYDDVKPMTAEQTRDMAELNLNVDKFLKDLKVTRPVIRDKSTLLQNVWYRPTFEVHGDYGAYSGKGPKTVIPSEVRRHVSMKLVPNQDPEKVAASFREYVKKLNPDVEVEIVHTLAPFTQSTNHPYMQAAFDSAHEGFGIKPAYVGCGGSIGAVTEMVGTLGKAPVVMLAVSKESDGYHSQNEHFELNQAEGGIKSIGRFLYRVGEIGRVVA